MKDNKVDSTQMALEVLAVIRKNKAKHNASEEGEEVLPKEKKEPRMTVEERFFSGQQKFVYGSNRKKFSEVFKWSPSTIPDIPVPQYTKEHWDSKVQSRIPEVNSAYYLHKSTIEAIMYGVYCTGTLLFHGATGTGKTSVAEQIAAHCGMPFFRVSCHGQMEVSDLLGSKSIVVQDGVSVTASNDTDVTLAAKFGGMLCLDEVFRLPPECLMSLQSLFEYPHKLCLLDAHGTDTVVDVTLDDFNLVLTDNTTGNGSANGAYIANAQDQSTQNRIRRAILIDYLPQKEEYKILASVYPDIPKSILRQMTKIAREVRSLFETGDLQHTFSIRELLSWCESLMHLRDNMYAFRVAYYDKLEDSDKAPASDIFEQEFGLPL